MPGNWMRPTTNNIGPLLHMHISVFSVSNLFVHFPCYTLTIILLPLFLWSFNETQNVYFILLYNDNLLAIRSILFQAKIKTEVFFFVSEKLSIAQRTNMFVSLHDFIKQHTYLRTSGYSSNLRNWYRLNMQICTCMSYCLYIEPFRF